MPVVTSILFFCAFATSAVASVRPSNNQIFNALEHLLVDTDGFNDAGMQKAITPCTNYVSGSQLLGRETAAQWVRVAFHDFVTANVEAGTGGIDASIGFETLRAENSGSAMNDSLGFFAPFVNAHVSMADMIALSVVMSIGTCSSPNIHIPLRGGRIDALEGGAFGVPEPETDLEETLSEFASAGFNQPDAIGLTICGHSLGSVHHGGFPQVVPESAVTPNNTGGGIHFDATPDVFDADVLHEYLEWRGQMGGPLVTTDNITVRSDLRLYTSDNNATLQNLAATPNKFIPSCISLLERMIHTVPTPDLPQLTNVITPIALKPVNVSLAVDSEGRVRFSGYIRLLSSSFSASDRVQIFWRSRDTSSSFSTDTVAATPASTGSSSIFNLTTFYDFFNTSIDSASGISAFTVDVLNGHGEIVSRSKELAVEDRVVFLPSETQVGEDGGVVLFAAILSSSNPASVTAILRTPSPQQGTISPTIAALNATFHTTTQKRGEYTLYSASAVLPAGANLDQTLVDVVAAAEGGDVTMDEGKWLLA